MLFSVCFSLAVMASAVLGRLLPSSFVLLLLLMLVIATACFYALFAKGGMAGRLFLLLSCAVAGFGYGNSSHQLALSKQLPAEFDRQILTLNGVVRDVLVNTSSRQRFVFQVDRTSTLGAPLRPGSLLLLNWYDSGETVAVGEYWQFKTRLKAPRGFVNPAGFDYQGWLLRKGISATGSVKGAEKISAPPDAVVSASAADHARDSLRRWLAEQDVRYKGLLKALLIGDKNSISASQWALMRDTGTAHLMAISGLHIGLIALLGCGFGAFLGRAINALYMPLPSVFVAHLCGALFAVAYAALAGFSTPTVRALIMVLTVQLCALLFRIAHKRLAFVLALLVIALVEPLAVWDAGFWLSFLAALVLILLYSGRYQKALLGRARLQHALVQALRSQWYLFFGLLIPLLLLMQRATLLAPVANIVAIPMVSLLLVPLLAASVLTRLCPGVLGEWLSHNLLVAADTVCSILWQILAAIERFKIVDYVALGTNSFAVWLPIGLAVVLLLLPKGVPGRVLSYPVILLPFAFVPYSPPDVLRATFMDVGQGTAVVISAAGRTLVYDTGRRFSQKFDAGSGIISPYLDSIGARVIDRLVISHGDADHSGGAGELSRRHKVLQLHAPRELILCLSSGADNCLPQSWHATPRRERIDSELFLPCEQAESWRWGITRFSLFSSRSEPLLSMGAGRGQNPKSHERNNRSCLLLVEHKGVRVLLSGDIEAIAERSLLASGLLSGPVDWMSAPHHGSKTSSSEALLQHLKPASVVFQYGHNNSYRHPNKAVLERYQALGSSVEATDSSGAIQLVVDAAGEQRVIRWRENHRRFWY